MLKNQTLQSMDTYTLLYVLTYSQPIIIEKQFSIFLSSQPVPFPPRKYRNDMMIRNQIISELDSFHFT